jgi:protein TonB
MDSRKQNIPDFNDILFENRNKEYGAYFMRKRYNRTVVFSITMAVIIGSVAVLIPYLRMPALKKDVVYNVHYVSIENMRKPAEQIAVPDVTVPAPPPHTAEAVKYVAPEVVDSVKPFENSEILTADMMPLNTPDQSIFSGSGTETGILSDIEGGGAGNNEPFLMVEVMPTFKGGGIEKFREWVFSRTIYPKSASDNGIAGTVLISFIIETDGSVSNVELLKGVDPLLDNEAMRVISTSPKWTPGRQRGAAVRIRCQIPITFQN